MDLQQYDRMKMALAAILRGATMRRLPERSPEIARDLFARLAEDRFNLVVVGRFSRGKTSLMNAMLGTDRLPTGIVPLTSVITTVAYGSEEKAILHYQNTRLFSDIPVPDLAAYITERGNPGNARRIAYAEVQLPADLLRRGFHFIDTPGLGSSITENTRTTEAFLPEADACILVTSYDSPFSEEEQRVLGTVHQSGRRTFIVVNKEDCVAPAQRREVLEHLATRLPAIFGSAIPPLYSLSARRAAEARLRGDAALLADSGLPALESALVNFLIYEKSRAFLRTMCGRIETLLEGEAGAEQDLERLRALRAECDRVRPGTPDDPAIPETPDTAILPTIPGCEICAAVDDALFSFLAEYQYRLGGDHRMQAELAKRHGLCRPHAWRFATLAAPKDTCTGFAATLERQSACLRAAALQGLHGPLASAAVDAVLPTASTCPACAVVHRAAKTAAGTAADRLTREGVGGLAHLSAVCLPHLRLLLAAVESPELVRGVLLREAFLLERLAEDMRHFAIKRDGLLRHLTTKEEAGAGERALSVLVGSPAAEMGPGAPRSSGRESRGTAPAASVMGTAVDFEAADP